MKQPRFGLLMQLAGPGFPPPVGRHRTFIEWVIHTGFQLACLFVSLTALAFAALTVCATLLGLVAAQ